MKTDATPESSPFLRPEQHEEIVDFSREVMISLIQRQNLNPSELLALGSLMTWLEEYPDLSIECRHSLQVVYRFGDKDYSQTHSFTWAIIDESFDFSEDRITTEKGVGSDSETLFHYAFEAPEFRTCTGSPDFEELLQKIREFLSQGAKVELAPYD